MRMIYLLLYILLLGAVQVRAQRVSRDFHNVTMPTALQQLGSMTHRYTINFIYNDLEDFRVTASVRRETIPEAIRHLIGFYPISMTMVGDSIINVECSQKTVLRYKGRVIDEKGEPAEYANVVLLSPADSSFLAGGVSNESGYFVIPCNARRVIAKVTYVGYKSKLWTTASPDLGTIRLQADRYTLKGVTVQGHKLSYKPSPNGLSVMVKGSQLEQFGSAKEMIKHLPLVMGDGTVAGHGTPQIYINNKLVRDASELERLQTAEVLSAEIITRPGAEYASDVTSVIRLKTVRRQGEGWSGSLWGNFEKSKGMLATANASLNYRLRNGMDFFIRANAADSKGRITATSNDQLKATDTWDYHSRIKWRNDYNFIYGDVVGTGKSTTGIRLALPILPQALSREKEPSQRQSRCGAMVSISVMTTTKASPSRDLIWLTASTPTMWADWVSGESISVPITMEATLTWIWPAVLTTLRLVATRARGATCGPRSSRSRR